jgi:hypothetical protein
MLCHADWLIVADVSKELKNIENIYRLVLSNITEMLTVCERLCDEIKYSIQA